MANNLFLSFADTIDDNFTKVALRNIYAIVLNPLTEEALDSSPAPYVLDDFDGDNSRFAFILSQGVFRTKYYSLSIPSASLTLPDLEYGDTYEIEYWAEAASGVQNRTNDSFLRCDKFIWDSGVRVDNRISLVQEDLIGLSAAVQVWDRLKALAEATPDSIGEYLTSGVAATNYTAFCSGSYDPITQTLSVLAWLEKDGEIQLDAKNVTVTILDTVDTQIVQDTTAIINVYGGFRIQFTPVVLVPDTAYQGVCAITDVNDEVHTTGFSPTSWD